MTSKKHHVRNLANINKIRLRSETGRRNVRPVCTRAKIVPGSTTQRTSRGPVRSA